MLTLTACSDDEPEALKVSLNENSIQLHYFESYTLKPIVESGNIDLSKVAWSSSNEDIATVTEEGVVSANLIFDNSFSYSRGEAVISLSYDNSVLTTCKVTVTPWTATAISLNLDKVDLKVGESTVLKVTATADGNNTGVGLITMLSWDSSNSDVASVSNEGIISALSVGSTVITVRDTESGLTAKCDVTVTSKPVIGISCPESVRTIVGENVHIQAIVEPEDATNKKVIWSSSNPEIATVDNNGNVCGIALGETIVTAKTEDGGFEAKCIVKVVDLSDIITAVAIEGWTVSGANSNCHLTLLFETNTNIPVLINSVVMTDQDGTIMNIDYPNQKCTTFQKTYITHFFDASGGISGEAINAEKAKIKGWKFFVQYIWNNNEYTIECINR